MSPPVQAPEILQPQEYCEPQFHMGPFDSASLAANYAMSRAGAAAEPDWPALVGRAASYQLTVNAREAIEFALLGLGLRPDDEVVIATTSGSPYVSSCVTDAIGRVCRWSRTASPRAAAVLVIHEFGFPCRLDADLRALGLPVIEDCAYALGSGSAADGPVGRLGDWTVYSFSKAFPLQYGGLLCGPRPVNRESRLSTAGAAQLCACLGTYLANLEDSKRARQRLFAEYRDAFAAHGISPRFVPDAETVPHAFVVAMPDQAHAERMKSLLNRAGIESSVFYGGGGYFLPCHQSMSSAAVEYIVANFVAARNATC